MVYTKEFWHSESQPTACIIRPILFTGSLTEGLSDYQAAMPEDDAEDHLFKWYYSFNIIYMLHPSIHLSSNN